MCFFVFGIVNFYPSITEQQLDQAVKFSKVYSNITSDELNIIMQSRKTLHKKQPWVKKTG